MNSFQHLRADPVDGFPAGLSPDLRHAAATAIDNAAHRAWYRASEPDRSSACAAHWDPAAALEDRC